MVPEFDSFKAQVWVGLLEMGFEKDEADEVLKIAHDVLVASFEKKLSVFDTVMAVVEVRV